ncbi:MAG: primosomal protein N' [Saprospiraceae bacterium]|nr:primosomal protein N' [Saprospiraceae bacterium]
MQFCEVIVPVSVPNTFTYSIPSALQPSVAVGCRVEVEFGRRKRYSGIIKRLHNEAPANYAAKPIISLLDERPLITKNQLQLWEWVEQYYLAHPGEVMNAAVPAALRLTSETTILLKANEDFDTQQLTDDEFLIFEALSYQSEITIGDVQAILSKQQVYPLLSSMLSKEVIVLKETLQERYKPKRVTFIKLADNFQEEDALRPLLDQLNKAPKQQEILLAYLDMNRTSRAWVRKKELLERGQASAASLKALVTKGILLEEQKEIGRINDATGAYDSTQLSEEQQIAYANIQEAFTQKDVCLLHGITGSGKTHIYVKLIEEQVKQGKQVLYLLPEIALTTQIIRKLKQHFGSEVGVYHSKFNDAERVEIWNKTLNGSYKVVLGARSAAFLPFVNLGLIVIDEEHDASYKQYDPAPRYNARDMAIVVAKQFQAKVLLGSATPSFESYYNAQNNRYALVELFSRYGEATLPKIHIVNLYKQNIPGNNYKKFSKALIDELKSILDKKEQAILFRNRRGYSSFMQCTMCKNIPRCPNCDVSLTYHKYRHNLECHYCGFKHQPPRKCEVCGHDELVMIGLGTERIEEELSIFLPKAAISRMDYDTTRNKYGHQKIIDQFENRDIEVLVGTQMVTKGLDFDNVSLVGVMDADALINFPDFRAQERAFTLMEQVSGRAGRKEKEGKVIIQVRDERYPVLKYILDHDYKGFYQAAIAERKEFQYPPFYRMIKLVLKHRDRKKCEEAAYQLGHLLRQSIPQRIKGPADPMIGRINNYYLKELIILMQRKSDEIISTKKTLLHCIDEVKSLKGLKQLKVNINVDPV